MDYTKKVRFGGSEKLDKKDYDETVKVRLKQKIKKENDCWIWLGCASKHGYGVSSYRSKQTLVHRISWIVFRGELQKKMDICHHCDNPLCINPEHLFSGTAKDNMMDMFKKNRKSHKGEKHPRAKLNEKDIENIKEMRKSGMTQQNISDQFNVKQTTISSILNGVNWKHVKS